jgi:hypothetical protein
VLWPIRPSVSSSPATARVSATLRRVLETGVDLAAAALAGGLGHIDGQTGALLHSTHVRAYATTGEKPTAARALLAAPKTPSCVRMALRPATPASAAPRPAPSPAIPPAL